MLWPMAYDNRTTTDEVLEGVDLTGRRIVITGAASGLGFESARALASHGAHVTVLARSEERVAPAVDALRLLVPDGSFEPGVVDLADLASIGAFADGYLADHPAVDVLINNAGVIQAGPAEHMQLADFEDAMATHMWGPLYLMRAAAEHMRAQGHGRVVNIASIGGKVAVPHLLPYSTSKFALVGLSDGMRSELAKHNITVTTVCPGLMRTGSHFNALFKGQHRKEFSWFSVIDALPISSIDAQRAAHQILEACRRGDAQLVITPQAKLLALASALLPELTASGLRLMNRLLPGPADSGAGDFSRTGRESQSPVAPSVLTRLADRAAVLNNGLNGSSETLALD